MVAKGIFHVHLGELPGGYLVENLGYTFGFVIVIMARQQLFTENTVTAVLPIMHKPTPGNIGLLLRLWGVVLIGNLVGTAIAAWAFNMMPIFDDATRGAFQEISLKVMEIRRLKCSPMRLFPAGWWRPWCGCFPPPARQNRGDHHDDLADCARRYHPYRCRQR